MKSAGARFAVRTATLVAFILAIAATVWAADPPAQVGLPFEIGRTTVAAPYSQEAAAASGYAGTYLVVWQDKRSYTDYDIYGILVDSGGNPVSSESFLISRSSYGAGITGDQLKPAVAFNGTYFLVVWVDYREGGMSSHIYGSRVDTNGTVLDPGGIQVSLIGTVYQDEPAVASNGTDWEVVYQQYSTSIDIVGAKVQGNGAVVGRAALCNRADNEAVPAIAWNGSNYLLVWQDSRSAQASSDEIYGCLVTSANARSGSEFLISYKPGVPTEGAPGTQDKAAVASGSGGTCLVVWEDDRTADSAVYGARITSSGVVQDGGGVKISSGTGDKTAPGVGWNGSSYAVAWRDAGFSRTVRGARVSTGGSVLDTNGYQVSWVSVGTRGPEVAGGSGSCLVVYFTLALTNTDVYGSVVSGGAVVNQDILLSISPQDQPDYDAAFDGANYVVVWADNRNGTYAIYAARVMGDGTVLDPGGVLVSSSATEQVQPAIAWGGDRYLVVWSEGKGSAADIKGMRLSRDLSRLDVSPLTLCNAAEAQVDPAVAWNGTTFVAVWVDSRNATSPDRFTDIFGARVGTTGSPIALSAPVSVGTNNQLAPVIASDGSQFLVVWEDYRNSYVPCVYCARVTGTGSVTDQSGIRVTTTTGNKTGPKVAFDGTNYFIVWCDTKTDPLGDIYGVRMSKTATRVDASDRVIFAGTSIQDAPDVEWTGENYYVAWQDYRNDATSTCDIYFARMRADGTIVEAGGQLLTNDWYPERAPVIASGGSDWTTIFYHAEKFSIDRLMGRTCGDPLPIVYANIAMGKGKPDGTEVVFADKVVTAGTDQMDGCFYIEDPDRRSGIRVVGATGLVPEGSVVSVTGTLVTVDGERRLNASSIIISAGVSQELQPWGLLVRSLGGGALNQYTPGVLYGFGANNIGLLVRLWGKVVSPGNGYFYLRDNGLYIEPLQKIVDAKIVCPPGVQIPAEGTSVVVTGISSCEPSLEGSARRVLVRKASDLQQYP